MQLTEEDLLKAGEIHACKVPEEDSAENIARLTKEIDELPKVPPLSSIERISGEPYTMNPEFKTLPYTITECGSENNGGKTDYYQLDKAPFPIMDFDDFAEWRNLNGFQFNIGKVVWAFNVGRHTGTTYEREINKIIHYAKRELKRLEREKLSNSLSS